MTELPEALRDAGVPLAEAGPAAESAQATTIALDAHRSRVAAARAKQDEDERRARVAVAGLEAHRDVQTRQAPAQPYVGVVTSLGLAEAEQSAQTANELFAEVYRVLTAAGRPPIGSFWTMMRPGATPDEVGLLLGWPVASLPDPPVVIPGARIEAAVLPAREEVVVRCDPVDELAEGVLHPGAVTLMEQVAAGGRSGGLERVRQVGVLGDDGQPTTLELIYDLV